MKKIYQKNRALNRETRDLDGYRICRIKAIEIFLSRHDEFIYQTGNITDVLSDYEINCIMRDGKLSVARSREGIMW